MANSAFSNVGIGTGILAYHYFHAIVGTFPAGMYFFWESSVCTPERWMQPPHPTKAIIIFFFGGFTFLPLVSHFAERVFGSDGSAGSGDLGGGRMEFQGPQCREAAGGAGRAVKAAGGCCTQNEQSPRNGSNGASAALAALLEKQFPRLPHTVRQGERACAWFVFFTKKLPHTLQRSVNSSEFIGSNFGLSCSRVSRSNAFGRLFFKYKTQPFCKQAKLQ